MWEKDLDLRPTGYETVRNLFYGIRQMKNCGAKNKNQFPKLDIISHKPLREIHFPCIK